MGGGDTGGGSRNLILAAMIFAVAMTFIDQTIVSIAAPEIQKQLHLTSTGTQWAINAYLLSLAALFAFGGRLADTAGHRKMVTLGVILFAGASAMCGLTPKGSLAEAWIVTFRVIQGAGGAIMFPAALAIVVQTFELRERGRALAIFFGIAGGLTAIGPILGGYLTQWTWRAIFWVNLPVAAIALILIVLSKPQTVHRPARMDYKGLALIAAGVALSVFGFQQSSIWGWSDPATWACIVIGAALLVVFYFVQLRTESPLIEVSIFKIRPFLVENIVLGIAMLVFIPVFFFASEYAQIALGKTPSNAGVYILYFFIGFVIAAQVGGRMLDRIGAKRPVVLGCAISAVGFYLWAGKVTGLDFNTQQWYIIIAGAGMGMMLGPASTDAVNRASRLSYGEASGITQTVRNYAASLGLGDPRLDPRLAGALARHQVADLARRARRPCPPRSVLDRPVAQRQHRLDPPFHPARLRASDADGLLRDGGDHGGRGDRGLDRVARWRAGGNRGRSRGRAPDRARLAARRLPGQAGGLRAIADPERAVAVLEVLLGGARADPERRGGVLVGASHRDQAQHLGLARGQPQRGEVVEHDLPAGAAREGGVGERVAVGLDQVGADEVQEIALGRGEVAPAAAERDAEDLTRGGGEREGDLVLDPERHVDLAIEIESVQLASRDEVREAHRAAVHRPHVVRGQGILQGVPGEGDVQLGGNLRLDQRHRVRQIGGELVQRAPLRRHRLA